MPPTASTFLPAILSQIKRFAFIELPNSMSLLQAPLALALPPLALPPLALPHFRDFAMAGCVILRCCYEFFFKPLALGGKAECLLQRPLMLPEVGASGKQRCLKDV